MAKGPITSFSGTFLRLLVYNVTRVRTVLQFLSRDNSGLLACRDRGTTQVVLETRR